MGLDYYYKKNYLLLLNEGESNDHQILSKNFSWWFFLKLRWYAGNDAFVLVFQQLIERSLWDSFTLCNDLYQIYQSNILIWYFETMNTYFTAETILNES